MVKIGIVGAGGIAGQHLDSLKKIDQANVIAVADIDRDKADKLASSVGAKSYTSYDDLLKDDVDAVYVCVPPAYTAEIVLAVAGAHKHVFCEKPLATTYEQGRRVVDVCRSAQVKLMVGYILRFYPPFRAFKTAVNSGRLGDIVSIWCQRIGGFPYLIPWAGSMEMSGGMTVEFNTHDIDWMLWVAGRPTEVYGKVATVRDGIDNEDNMWGLITLEKGVGYITSSRSSHMGSNYIGIIGTRGTMVLDNSGKVRLSCVGRDEPEAVEEVQVEQTEPMLEEDKSFIRSIIDDTEPVITGEEALLDLEVALAIQKSATTGMVESIA